MKFLKMKEGFTLVELMVVVAIIGVLSAVAVPNFKKYQAKSKTSEAKLHLAAIYTAEQAFSSDYDTFAVCLVSMGYNPTNEAAQRYYATGFAAAGDTDTTTTAKSNGATTCENTMGTAQFKAGKKLGNVAAADVGNIPTTEAKVTEFTAGAGGFVHSDYVDPSSNSDQWTIDNDKALKHVRVGY